MTDNEKIKLIYHDVPDYLGHMNEQTSILTSKIEELQERIKKNKTLLEQAKKAIKNQDIIIQNINNTLTHRKNKSKESESREYFKYAFQNGMIPTEDVYKKLFDSVIFKDEL